MDLLGDVLSKKEQNDSSFVLESSLQSYFYTELQEVNERLVGPLPNETIFYSSLVMDKFGSVSNYFDISESGKVQNKVLGVKLLESSHLKGEAKASLLKDVGDTALLICGYFSDSLNKKIIDCSYYEDIGQSAYQQLNGLVPSFYDVPYFYDGLSLSFSRLTNVMNIVAQKTMGNSWDQDSIYLLMTDKKISA